MDSLNEKRAKSPSGPGPGPGVVRSMVRCVRIDGVQLPLGLSLEPQVKKMRRSSWAVPGHQEQLLFPGIPWLCSFPRKPGEPADTDGSGQISICQVWFFRRTSYGRCGSGTAPRPMFSQSRVLVPRENSDLSDPTVWCPLDAQHVGH